MPANTTSHALNYISKATIHTNYICFNRVPVAGCYSSRGGFQNLLGNRSERFKKSFNDKSRKKLDELINYFVSISPNKLTYCKELQKHVKFRINFVTLTLPAPQIHSDETIKSLCLNQFLVELRNKYNVTDYIWKAERQQNQNIHFHITINKFIHYSQVQNIWNRIVNKLGYVERFQNKHGHRNPHSTEIKSVKNVGKLGAYLSKYLTSKKKNDIIIGRSWSASQSITSYQPMSLYEGEDEFQQFNQLIADLTPPAKFHDFCSLYFAKYSDLVCRCIDLKLDKLLLRFASGSYTQDNILTMIDPDYFLNT